MAFVFNEIPDNEMHLFHNHHFYKADGSFMEDTDRAIDHARNMYLVCPGREWSGPGGGLDLYVFYMDGLYIYIYGDYIANRNYDDPVFRGTLTLPMNLAAYTKKIVKDIEDAFRIFDQRHTDSPCIDRIDFEVQYVHGYWVIDKNEDIILNSWGPNADFETYHARDLAEFTFCQGQREANTLYNFRLEFKEVIADFQARYIKRESKVVWSIEEIAIPKDFFEYKETLIKWVELAMQYFTHVSDNPPAEEINLANMLLSENLPANIWNEELGTKSYRSKYYPSIPDSQPIPFNLSAQELEKLERSALCRLC